MESKQYATAKSVREEEFKDFLSPLTGRLYCLYKVWTVDMVRDGVFSLEQAQQMETAKDKIQRGEELDPFEKALGDLFKRAMICRGVVDPATHRPWVLDRPANECGPDELSIHEFPRADYDLVFLEISKFSGIAEDSMEDDGSVVSAEPVEGDRFRSEGNGAGEGSPAVEEPTDEGSVPRARPRVRPKAQRSGDAGNG